MQQKKISREFVIKACERYSDPGVDEIPCVREVVIATLELLEAMQLLDAEKIEESV